MQGFFFNIVLNEKSTDQCGPFDEASNSFRKK